MTEFCREAGLYISRLVAGCYMACYRSWAWANERPDLTSIQQSSMSLNVWALLLVLGLWACSGAPAAAQRAGSPDSQLDPADAAKLASNASQGDLERLLHWAIGEACPCHPVHYPEVWASKCSHEDLPARSPQQPLRAPGARCSGAGCWHFAAEAAQSEAGDRERTPSCSFLTLYKRSEEALCLP